MPESVLIGVLAGVGTLFLGWLAKTLFLNRQLNLVQPKLFDYSGLSNNGFSKTLELTVINSGRRAEEDVKIQFAPGFAYTIIASNTSGLVVNAEGVLRIDRLAPRQEVNLVLVAEGGEFRKEHVLGLSSKDVVGKVKASLQEAQSTPAQAIVALLIFFLIIFPIGYGLGKFVEMAAWPSLMAAYATVDDVSFKVADGEVRGTAGVERSAALKLLSTVAVSSVRRKGDRVDVVLAMDNSTDARLKYSIFLSTAVSDKRYDELGIVNHSDVDLIVMAGTRRELTLSDYLPESVVPQLIVVEIRVESGDQMVLQEREVVVGATTSDVD